ITVRSFNLDTEYPSLQIAAAYSKRRREDTQYLHPDVVSRLRDWLSVKKPKTSDLLFPVTARVSGFERKTSEMMKRDLEIARAKWVAEAASPEEKVKREASDFLKYVDTSGRFADFHGLRHTFITNLCRSNVSPKTAQTLARHSDIALTMNIYSHVAPEEQAAAINALPGPGKR
ncbi:MAG: tyrosine-type recombinase/integrase, partial [Thermoguttaceae bacterium]